MAPKEARVLTWAAVLELARERAPLVALARAQIEEARARLTGASALLPDNPTLQAAGGARLHPDGVIPDVDVSLTQSVEVFGRRGARMDVAEQGIEEAEASAADAERSALHDAAAAFLRALYAEERIRLADEAVSAAEMLLQIAERRHAAGDVPLLDVNFAASTAARTRASRHTAFAARAAAAGELRAVLGLEAGEVLRVDGDLERLADLPPADGAASLDDRPDLRALRAAVAGAEAETRLGDSLLWPEVGVGAGYAWDDGDQVWTGIVQVPFPVFQNGAGARAAARTKAETLRRRHAATRLAAGVHVAAAAEVLAERRAAAEEVRRHALPVLAENVRLSRRGYEAGEAGLPEVLSIEREAFETGQQYLDLLLEAALARLELDFSTGALR